MVAPSVDQLVRQRAGNRCEYCRLPEAFVIKRFQIDHIVARQHLPDNSLENLALACHTCNSHKGPNLAGIDPVSGRLVPLFNPREQQWSDHFTWDGAYIVGTSDIGRVTVHVLNMNKESSLRIRSALLKRGLFFWKADLP